MDNVTEYSPSYLALVARVKQNNPFIIISVKDLDKGTSTTEIENIFNILCVLLNIMNTLDRACLSPRQLQSPRPIADK